VPEARETDGVSLGPEPQIATIIDVLNASGALEYGV